MITESRKPWTIGQFYELNAGEYINLNNPRQRADDYWTPIQQGLLIRSIITGYPIPPFYAIKNEGKYEVLDGKQRTTAFIKYLDDNYAVHKSIKPVKLNTGSLYELAGQKFSDLPPYLQDRIRNKMLDIVVLEDIESDDEIDEIFYLLNNGSKMDSVTKICAKAKSIGRINEMADHELFTSILTQKALNRGKNKEAVIKSWLAINTAAPVSFTPKDIENTMSEASITDDSILELWGVYDLIYKAINLINNGSEVTAKKIIANISTPNNFAALTIVGKSAIADEISAEDFSKWIVTFFPAESNSGGTSVSDEYNGTIKSNSSPSVQKRHTVILGNYRSMFKGAA